MRGHVEDVLLQMMQPGMLAGLASGVKVGQSYAGVTARELRVDLLGYDWAGTEQAMAFFSRPALVGEC